MRFRTRAEAIAYNDAMEFVIQSLDDWGETPTETRMAQRLMTHLSAMQAKFVRDHSERLSRRRDDPRHEEDDE